MFIVIVNYAAAGLAKHEFKTEEDAREFYENIKSGKYGHGYRYNDLTLAREILTERATDGKPESNGNGCGGGILS